MLNKELFKQTMREHGDTQANLAKALTLAVPSVNRKINETRGSCFTVGELCLIKERYQLSAEQACAIFFGK